jgi:hypothetical protein
MKNISGNLEMNAKKISNKANQHGSLKASRKKRATLLTPSYLRRYALKTKTWKHYV